MNLKGRNFLKLLDYTPEEIGYLLDLAAELKAKTKAGSLFLGGLVCGLAFALDIPLILILVGIIYICETMSDIIQVTYFKLTHGKRIFRMAPLHHHLEMGGWSEVKLFTVFTAITAVCCILAYLGIMNRFPV